MINFSKLHKSNEQIELITESEIEEVYQKLKTLINTRFKGYNEPEQDPFGDTQSTQITINSFKVTRIDYTIQIPNLPQDTINHYIDSINKGYLNNYKTLLEGLNRGIPNLNQILGEYRQRLDDRAERLNLSFQNLLTQKKNLIERNTIRPFYIQTILQRNCENLQNLAARLENVSIDSVLKRGFAWIRDSRGQTLYSVEEARRATNLEIRFADGIIKTKPIGKKNDLQGDLFDI